LRHFWGSHHAAFNRLTRSRVPFFRCLRGGISFFLIVHIRLFSPDYLRLFQNFSFWNSFLDLKGKTGLLTGFSKGLFKTNRVLEQAHLLGNAQGIEAVSFFAEGKKDTSG
jgi:hypothetical protein